MNLRTRIGACVAIAAASAIAAAPAVAATKHVHGVQTLVKGADTQTPTDDVYTMSGGLVGSWYTDTFDLQAFDPTTGWLVGTGTEHFNGCLDNNRNAVCGPADPAGTLKFAYVLWARFDTTTGAQIEGRCVHPVTTGSGDFASAMGVLSFVDDPVAHTSAYRGAISYSPTGHSTARLVARQQRAASRRPGTSCG